MNSRYETPRNRKGWWYFLLLLGLGSSSPAHATSNKISTFAVGNYSDVVPLQCSFCCSLGNVVPNVNGFRSGMLTGSGFWAAGLQKQNSAVIDNALVDPDATGVGTDTDTSNFDRALDAIAYFNGHGVCDGATNQLCTSTSQCNSPTGSGTMPSSCKQGAPGSGFPPLGQGWCHYYTPRHAVTCTSVSTRGNDVLYSTGLVRLGESPYSGAWRGAGTNGGINLAVLDVSCGANPEFYAQQLSPAFAGLHILATIMPVTGDTAMVANRGSTFAARWAANANSSVAQSWALVVADLGGANCANGGINGCGCNIAVGHTNSSTDALYRVAGENWVDLKSDLKDVTGGGFTGLTYYCNYNSTLYPWHLP